MPDAVIVAAARTPIGTARKGTLLDVSAFDLAKYAVAETLKRSGIPSTDVDDLALGESLQGGGDIARYAAVDLGLSEIPGVALNRHCASGMASVQGAAASIMAGMDTVVIAGGSESLSIDRRRSMKRTLGTDDWAQWMSPSHPATPDAPAFDMSITVGYNTAQSRRALTRADCDAWALRSHERADRRDRRRPPAGRDLRDRSHDARRHDEDLRHRRAPAPRLHDGEDGVAEAVAPRDRGLPDHGRQLVGRQRRVPRR